jgi:hypothetical protein
VDQTGSGTNEQALWKLPLLMVVFLATFIPYVIVALLASPLDLVSFAIAWILFFALRARLPERLSLFASLACGLLLAFPTSAFLYVHNDGSISFHFGYGFAYGDNTFFRVLYFVLLMSAAHHVAGSKRISCAV